jgi:putative protease
MTTKHCLKYWLNSCPKKAKAELEFKEPLYLTQGGKRYKLKFDCQNCQMEIYNQ